MCTVCLISSCVSTSSIVNGLIKQVHKLNQFRKMTVSAMDFPSGMCEVSGKIHFAMVQHSSKYACYHTLGCFVAESEQLSIVTDTANSASRHMQ